MKNGLQPAFNLHQILPCWSFKFLRNCPCFVGLDVRIDHPINCRLLHKLGSTLARGVQVRQLATDDCHLQVTLIRIQRKLVSLSTNNRGPFCSRNFFDYCKQQSLTWLLLSPTHPSIHQSNIIFFAQKGAYADLLCICTPIMCNFN